MVAGLASLSGAGAVVMWNPPRVGVMGRALFWIVAAALVVYGVTFFLVPL